MSDAYTTRRMPDSLKPYMVKVQGGKMYLPAAYRLAWFREECPDWGIETHLLEGGQHAGFATMQAKIVDPQGRVIATAHKTETQADFPAGWVEKSETGAVARALSLAGFGTEYSQDMDENGRSTNGSPPETEFWTGPGQCPRCHAPVGKKHGKPCAG